MEFVVLAAVLETLSKTRAYDELAVFIHCGVTLEDSAGIGFLATVLNCQLVSPGWPQRDERGMPSARCRQAGGNARARRCNRFMRW